VTAADGHGRGAFDGSTGYADPPFVRWLTPGAGCWRGLSGTTTLVAADQTAKQRGLLACDGPDLLCHDDGVDDAFVLDDGADTAGRWLSAGLQMSKPPRVSCGRCARSFSSRTNLLTAKILGCLPVSVCVVGLSVPEAPSAPARRGSAWPAGQARKLLFGDPHQGGLVTRVDRLPEDGDLDHPAGVGAVPRHEQR
jgi:hypothetical protein